jgi:2-polyprenyl-6-methoxyphenol hydroxylase-like FAD-dependent oxidoreductase
MPERPPVSRPGTIARKADAGMNRNLRILIAGAGPTGLTGAVELARRGFRPRIIDKDPGPTPLSKAVGISPNILDLLAASGVTERLLALGFPIRLAQVRSG